MTWLIDAMNVIGSRPDGWWRDRSGAQCGFIERVIRLAMARGLIFWVVLDGRPLEGYPEGMYSGVQVTYASSGSANAADDRIVDIARRLPGKHIVVTSDRALGRRLQAMGVQVLGSSAFLRWVERMEREDPRPNKL